MLVLVVLVLVANKGSLSAAPRAECFSSRHSEAGCPHDAACRDPLFAPRARSLFLGGSYAPQSLRAVSGIGAFSTPRASSPGGKKNKGSCFDRPRRPQCAEPRKAMTTS